MLVERVRFQLVLKQRHPVPLEPVDVHLDVPADDDDGLIAERNAVRGLLGDEVFPDGFVVQVHLVVEHLRMVDDQRTRGRLVIARIRLLTRKRDVGTGLVGIGDVVGSGLRQPAQIDPLVVQMQLAVFGQILRISGRSSRSGERCRSRLWGRMQGRSPPGSLVSVPPYPPLPHLRAHRCPQGIPMGKHRRFMHGRFGRIQKNAN